MQLYYILLLIKYQLPVKSHCISIKLIFSNRYLYLRKIWKDNHGIEEGSWSFKLSMQQEIFVQCLCNMGLLSTPMFLQAFGYFTGPLTTLEIMGWVLWLSSLGNSEKRSNI